MIFKLARRYWLYAFMLLAPLSISGCDGGLFGTGDGGIIVDTASEITGNTTGDGSTDADIDGSNTDDLNTTDGSTTSDTTSDVDSEDTTAGIEGGASFLPTLGSNVLFVNDSITLANQKILLNVINTSSATISLEHTDTVTGEQSALSEQGVSSTQTLNNIELSNDITAIYIQNNDTGEYIGVFGPFTLNPSTLTTLWINDSSDSDDNAVEHFPTTAIALVSSTQTSDPTLAKVRVLQANTTRPEITVALLTSGESPGGIDFEFDTLAPGNLASAYVELPAGEFELLVDGISLSEQLLSLEGGNVYTLVLLDTETPAFLLNVDSDSNF